MFLVVVPPPVVLLLVGFVLILVAATVSSGVGSFLVLKPISPTSRIGNLEDYDFHYLPSALAM